MDAPEWTVFEEILMLQLQWTSEFQQKKAVYKITKPKHYYYLDMHVEMCSTDSKHPGLVAIGKRIYNRTH